MVRRYFFNARNEKHYNKKWRKEMGGISLDGVSSEWVRGQVTPEHKVQEAVDSLNAAIDRLDSIINNMKEMGQNNGSNNKPR
jgi:hypothetical protein